MVGHSMLLDHVVEGLAAIYLWYLDVHQDFAVHILTGVVTKVVIQALFLVEKFKNFLES